MTTIPNMEHLVGPAEIGRMLGVSRQRVSQLVNTADFPQPAAVLAMGSVWNTDDIRAWAARKGRTINDD